MHRLIFNDAIHSEVILDMVAGAGEFVWIVTADIKDMHIKKGRRYVPFLSMLADLISKGVAIRLIHAKEPGPRFRKDFDLYPELIESPLFERILCPRVHTKAVVVDAKKMFVGSANLTGAGMGVKHADKRNFEAGVVTDEPQMVTDMMEWVDQLYLGDFCGRCKIRKYCPDPIR